MKIAVVILNWNGADLLKKYIPSVLQYSKNCDIWVIDNASTDNSVEIVNELFPEVKIVKLNSNHGYAGGYNMGLKEIDADVFCLLNSDVEVTKGWINPIVTLFNKRPDVAIVQPKILDLKNREYFEYAGAAGGFIDSLGYPFCRGRIFQSMEKDMGQYDDEKAIFWATGACMFIRSEAFNTLAGFDEDYFAHQEEIDLCWRANNKGFRVFYTGHSKVYHLGGSTLSNMDPKKTFLNFRNSLFSITKNLPTCKAFLIIFVRLVLDGVAALRFLAQFKALHFMAIIHAHASFYYNFRKTYKKRDKSKYILKYHSITSVVWSHYVYGIKYFNKLVKD